MSKQEIEDEIQARLEFKMNEMMDGLKNRIKFKYSQAWDMTRESQYHWQAFEEVATMMMKEMKMAPPNNEMAKTRKWEAKEKAVNNLIGDLKLYGTRDYDIKVRCIVRAIEKAQNW